MSSGVRHMPVTRREEEAFAADAAEFARDAVGGLRASGAHQRARERGMRLDRDVAIAAYREIRSDADSEPRDAAQIGRDAMFLHARVDDCVGRAQRDEIGHLHRRDGDAVMLGEDVDEFDHAVRALAENAVDLRAVVEQRIIERHAAADHRGERIVAERNAKIVFRQTRRDGRGDLVGP